MTLEHKFQNDKHLEVAFGPLAKYIGVLCAERDKAVEEGLTLRAEKSKLIAHVDALTSDLRRVRDLRQQYVAYPMGNQYSNKMTSPEALQQIHNRYWGRPDETEPQVLNLPKSKITDWAPRRLEPRRAGQSWTDHEEFSLAVLYREGLSLAEIAEHLEREQGAVVMRLAKISSTVNKYEGLSTEQQLTERYFANPRKKSLILTMPSPAQWLQPHVRRAWSYAVKFQG